MPLLINNIIADVTSKVALLFHKVNLITLDIIIIIAYTRIIWLISACAYSGKRNDSMRLIKDMRLYGT